MSAAPRTLPLLRSSIARTRLAVPARVSRVTATTAIRPLSSLGRPYGAAALRPQVRRHDALTSSQQRRYSTTPAAEEEEQQRTVYDYQAVEKIIRDPGPGKILIDVREPAEYEAGFIPTAINIPIASQPDAFFLPPEEFEERFGFTRPGPHQDLVMYCKAGVRSRAAAQLARQAGYERVAEYPGSWLDWVKNGGETSKRPTSESVREDPTSGESAL